MLAVNPLTVHDHVEDAFFPDDCFHLHVTLAELRLQFGRQTGGLRCIVSLAAVGNLNFHFCVPPLVNKINSCGHYSFAQV